MPNFKPTLKKEPVKQPVVETLEEHVKKETSHIQKEISHLQNELKRTIPPTKCPRCGGEIYSFGVSWYQCKKCSRKFKED
jgi:tRNA(Ile2) C34 agmatinyltransferase TiaS